MATSNEERQLARSRALRYLAQAAMPPLGAERSLPPGLEQRELDRQRTIAFDAAAELYIALGLITAPEADEWRRTGEAAHEAPPQAVPPPRSPPAAERLLTDLLDTIEPMPPDKSPSLASGYGRAMAALTAAGVVGDLSASDSERWTERIAEQAYGDVYRRERERRRHDLIDLERVIPGPAARPSGLTLISAELYADGCLLVWQRPWSPDPGTEPRTPDFPKPTVSDDAGTEFRVVGGSGGSSGEHWRGRSIVLPAPPTDAQTLVVRFG
ncbi:MAG: hypothetical protein ACRDJY_10905, partial [Thermoleophilaceae bacterium]